MAEWSDWEEVEQDPEDASLGIIPEELLPAKACQWKWEINTNLNVGTGTTTVNMGWDFRIGTHRFTDTAPFVIWAQSDPFDPGAISWTYYVQNAATVRTEGEAERAGQTTGQLMLETELGGTEGMGADVNLWGHLVSDIWDGVIEEGEGVEFLGWYPQNGILHGKSLWLRTVKGIEDMQTVLDPATHNKHEFWLSGKTLLARKRSRMGGSFDVVISGCEVTATATAARVNVENGVLIIQGNPRFWDGGQADAPGGTYDVMLGVDNGEVKLQLVGADDGINQPAVRIANVKGTTVKQGSADRGVIVTRDCDGQFSAWIEDDGTLMVDVGSVEKRKVYRSRDRGAVWNRKLG